MAKLSTPLPANLPENWTYGQIIAPTGQEVGLPTNYGYNYLMNQVNNAQKASLELDSKKAELDMSNVDHPQEAIYNLGAGVRHNLIDNWGFQVWQRYPDGSFNGIPNQMYIADRFTFQVPTYTPIKLTRLEPFGIQNEPTNETGVVIRYFFDNTEQFEGKTMAFTVWKNSGLHTITKIVSGWDRSQSVFEYFGIGYAMNPGDTLYAVKLEYGETQTLVRQTDNGYVLLDEPNYMLEFLKCRKYLYAAPYAAKISYIGTGNFLSDHTGICIIDNSVDFSDIVIPTVIGTATNFQLMLGNSSVIVPTSVSYDVTSGNGKIVLDFTGNFTGHVGESFCARCLGTRFLLSAERIATYD